MGDIGKHFPNTDEAYKNIVEIPQEIKENVLKIIKKNPNYLFFNKN